ncbi:sn-glycerol-3-phosphate ABC transporter ATP-binding protein UgpC [Devosia sp. YIM 151766]|uniref:ABC transporter ATP-binding protein n=1 Tax=Devosia sp. YIM 151766 TaxID=3017325 RepID=UPI00255C35AE|nr:sn-glycerol-3-phosphate ABC transporter ATP-binding protein UgpC [Devosia sp. YIM 151766]WIY53583.1 sn-glycerol-3-phosphate ABC transporter ATP-binding protein UgpC [Devosia sp. YIM 151766]
MADIKITNLRKNFGPVEVLRDINLDIKSGEFVIFVGPSGCGKSTLLRCISGLESITSGTLEIGGRVVNRVPASKRGIAMVFQSYALYPHMSVRENMAYSMKLRRAPRAEIEARVADAARKLQLEPYLDRYPRELSGGQRQRVAIGRAIVRDPQVFLFDEPLSNLDAALRVATRLEIAKLKEGLPQTTMVYVTHDQVEAMTLADRIVVLNAGRVEQIGTPEELYEHPQSLFVAGFIGSPKMNLLNGPQAEAAGAHTVGIRPEDITLGLGPHQGKVGYVEYLGADTYVFLDIGQGELLTVRQTSRDIPAIGEMVSYDYPAARLHRFDASGVRLA